MGRVLTSLIAVVASLGLLMVGLLPVVASAEVIPFSPWVQDGVGDGPRTLLTQNGDGFTDRAQLWVHANGTVAVASGVWSLGGYDGHLILGPHPLTPDQVSGRASVTLDPLAETGAVLPAGTYLLRFDLVAVDGQQGTVLRQVDVWTPDLRHLVLDTPTIYPYSQRSVPFAVAPTLRTVVRGVTVRGWVEDTHGVLTEDRGWTFGDVKGSILADWRGRTTAGTIAPAGRYRLAYEFTSDSGESATYYTPYFTLSYQRAVERIWTATVTARSSLVHDGSRGCGRLRIPGRLGRGSVGYRSKSRCGRHRNRRHHKRLGMAAGLHEVILPAAVEQLRVRITANGTGSWALLEVQPAPRAIPTRLVLDGKAVRTPWLRNQTLDGSRRLSWKVSTLYGNVYAISSFTIQFDYITLV